MRLLPKSRYPPAVASAVCSRLSSLACALRSPPPEIVHSMQRRHFILATAGHVDHGKSALVRALTGTDPTHLPEEKARGITIDLGFAHLELPHPAEAGTVLDVGVVDVPGHEDFVKNMVAGVGSIDVALLVVAADDGWMPQTEEHLQILDYLGIRHGVIALSKSDLVADPEPVAQEIRLRLAGSPLAQAPIVPVSTLTGAGLTALRSALAEVIALAPSPPDVGKPRLWVDRALSLRGVGTVLTGTLLGGTFRRGDSVVVEPGGWSARIRSLQSHHHECDTAGPGRRVALSLPELTVRRTDDRSPAAVGVRRGDVVTLPALSGAGRTWEVWLVRSGRGLDELRAKGGSFPLAQAALRPLKDGVRVKIHHGSAHGVARAVLLGSKELHPGDASLAQLRFEVPMPAFIGDRFVLRDGSGQATMAGGVVLDPEGVRAGCRGPARLAVLARRAASVQDVAVVLRTELERSGVADAVSLLPRSGFRQEAVATALSGLVEAGSAVLAGGRVVEGNRWRAWVQSAVEAVETEHRDHPERVGLELSKLRAQVLPLLPEPELFEAIVAELGRAGLVLTGLSVRRISHRPALPPLLQAAGERVRAALSARPLEPPARREIAPDAVAQQALRFFIETGQVVEIGSELVVLAEAFTRGSFLVKGHLRRHGSATVSQLREVLGTSRRVIVPLLEKLDRDGVTVREGDLRRLKVKTVGP